MDTTITRHMTEYWLTALKQIAATRASLRASDSPEPPELKRLHRAAAINYANAAIGLAFSSFEDACDFACTTAFENERAVGVVNLIKHTWRNERAHEWAVYPANSVPIAPPYIKIDQLTCYYGDFNVHA